MALDITIGTALSPILALIFGIIILVFPKALSKLIGLYLVIIGIVGLLGLF